MAAVSCLSAEPSLRRRSSICFGGLDRLKYSGAFANNRRGSNPFVVELVAQAMASVALDATARSENISSVEIPKRQRSFSCDSADVTGRLSVTSTSSAESLSTSRRSSMSSATYSGGYLTSSALNRASFRRSSPWKSGCLAREASYGHSNYAVSSATTETNSTNKEAPGLFSTAMALARSNGGNLFSPCDSGVSSSSCSSDTPHSASPRGLESFPQQALGSPVVPTRSMFRGIKTIDELEEPPTPVENLHYATPDGQRRDKRSSRQSKTTSLVLHPVIAQTATSTDPTYDFVDHEEQSHTPANNTKESSCVSPGPMPREKWNYEGFLERLTELKEGGFITPDPDETRSRRDATFLNTNDPQRSTFSQIELTALESITDSDKIATTSSTKKKKRRGWPRISTPRIVSNKKKTRSTTAICCIEMINGPKFGSLT